MRRVVTMPVIDDALGDALARSALELAQRFHARATMWCVAPDWPEHARHVAVEFVHPVVVGKRALPAVAVTGSDIVSALRASVLPGDIVVAVGREDDPVLDDVLARTEGWGATSVWLGFGERPPSTRDVDHLLWSEGAGPDAAHDGRLVLLYHVLWELTHVCFEHPNLFETEARPDRDLPDQTATSDFLYPFLGGRGTAPEELLTDLAASAQAKAAATAALRSATLTTLDGALEAAADAMRQRFVAGGRLYTFGNGGSSTDAESVAALFASPDAGPPVAARSLALDTAVVTALGNDVGFSLVFVRQLIAHARAGDVVLGLSTSGNSDNVMAAFVEAKRRDLLTVGLAGHRGGAMAECEELDHCLVVDSDSVHRIQETQQALACALRTRSRPFSEEGR